MTSTLQLETQKQSMRGEARVKRRAITADAHEDAAKEVVRLGLELLDNTPGIVGAYYPVRSEFDCLPLARQLADRGWRIALPVVVGCAPLEFHEWPFGSPVATGPFGIPQPVGGEPVSPNVVMVPLLAFDRRCYRLGYGGGHYDRTLAALRRQGPITALGMAFDSQEVESIPVCPYDERLDLILTPSGPISAKEGS